MLVKTTIIFLWGLFDAHLLKFIFLNVVVHLLIFMVLWELGEIQNFIQRALLSPVFA
jgi:hypothetical protein